MGFFPKEMLAEKIIRIVHLSIQTVLHKTIHTREHCSMSGRIWQMGWQVSSCLSFATAPNLAKKHIFIWCTHNFSCLSDMKLVHNYNSFGWNNKFTKALRQHSPFKNEFMLLFWETNKMLTTLSKQDVPRWSPDTRASHSEVFTSSLNIQTSSTKLQGPLANTS